MGEELQFVRRVSAAIMNATSFLTGSHLRTYTAIFQHPISRNLEWREVYALFRNLGQVHEELNGSLKVVRNQQTLVLRPPRTKDVTDEEQVIALRHFLERSELDPPEPKGTPGRWLLVIDPHQARVFKATANASRPQQILSHQAEGHTQRLFDFGSFLRGEEKPDPHIFFGKIANALDGGDPILVLGPGLGSGSEIHQFGSWIKHHRPEVAARIVGSVVVDESHLTDDQLLAKARQFFDRSAAKTRSE
jgi:hypothetical protein